MSGAAVMLVALALDWVLGWPDALYRRIGHPVTWIGGVIDMLDRRFNRPDRTDAVRRMAGGFTVAVATGLSVLAALVLEAALPGGWVGIILAGVLAWPLLAARSLQTHVAAVARPLEAGDTGAARQAVSMIVGRDPERLESAGIARAGLESLAENTSDGVIAPVFWGLLLGLPGIAGYKAINTLDSMIGYRTDRHLHFGRVAARLDDVANWVPARVTAALMALASGRPLRVWPVVRRDAPAHRSPNAGWPEGAMAAALGCRLSGPRAYAGGMESQPWLNAGAPDPDGAAMQRGLQLYRRVLMLAAALLALLAAI